MLYEHDNTVIDVKNKFRGETCMDLAKKFTDIVNFLNNVKYN